MQFEFLSYLVYAVWFGGVKHMSNNPEVVQMWRDMGLEVEYPKVSITVSHPYPFDIVIPFDTLNNILRDLVRDNKKINAIKLLRHAVKDTQVGLGGAKSYVESL